jgi:TonB family protein
MISLLLLAKISVVLGLGGIFLKLGRGISPAARHFVCVATLALALLLPFSPSVAPSPALHVLAIVARSAAATEIAHPSPIHWLQIIWLAGALAIFVRFLTGLLYVHRKTRLATPYDIPDSNIGVRLAPVASPIVWGWLRPEILLPESAVNWPKDRLRLALLHEQAHVNRRDIWTALIVIAAKTVYWFHPLAWWLSARATEEQELACDDRVLDAGGSAKEYAELLVETAREFRSPILFGCPMVGHSNSLRGRIMHILQFRTKPRSARWSRSATAVFSSLLIGAGVLLAATQDKEPVYKIGGDVNAPAVTTKVEPEYTDEARANKIQGAVLLSVIVNRSGLPNDIAVVRGLDAGLDQAAINAIQQWRFAPATKAGEPVSVKAQIEVHFRLK